MPKKEEEALKRSYRRRKRAGKLPAGVSEGRYVYGHMQKQKKRRRRG